MIHKTVDFVSYDFARVFVFSDEYVYSIRHYRSLYNALLKDFSGIPDDEITCGKIDKSAIFHSTKPVVTARVPADHPALKEYYLYSPIREAQPRKIIDDTTSKSIYGSRKLNDRKAINSSRNQGDTTWEERNIYHMSNSMALALSRGDANNTAMWFYTQLLVSEFDNGFYVSFRGVNKEAASSVLVRLSQASIAWRKLDSNVFWVQEIDNTPHRPGDDRFAIEMDGQYWEV